MPELEGHAERCRQRREKLAQAVGRLLEVRGELEEQRAELVAEPLGSVTEVAQRLVHVAEPGEVGDPLRSLEDVGEAGGGGRGPARDGLHVRHPVERRVVREHLRGRELVGIERPLPLRVVVARGPDVDLQRRNASSGVGASPIASATAGWTTFPPQTLTPLASAGFARTAATTPRVASSRA